MNKKIRVTINYDAANYSEDQGRRFSDFFGAKFETSSNKVYRFAEIPPPIIEMVVNLSNLVDTSVKSGVGLGIGFAISKHLLSRIIDDLYGGVKKLISAAFKTKSGKEPVILISLIYKDVVIKASLPKGDVSEKTNSIKNLYAISDEAVEKTKILGLRGSIILFSHFENGKWIIKRAENSDGESVDF